MDSTPRSETPADRHADRREPRVAGMLSKLMPSERDAQDQKQRAHLAT